MLYQLLKHVIPVLFISASLGNQAHAEVESVTVRWTSQLCQKTCGTLLEKELKKVNGVDKVSIDLSSGQATLTWKPMVPFAYSSINTAMHMVGIAMRDMRLRVKGRIGHTGETVYIVSEGNNTRFDLVNPVVPSRTGQSVVYNAAGRKLSPELRQQLLTGESQGLIATIEGPVFMPERMIVPTQIVVERLNFAEEPKKEVNAAPGRGNL